MAEGAGLENRYTRKGIVGSNPTLSAVFLERVPAGPSPTSIPAAPPPDLIAEISGVRFEPPEDILP